VIIIDEISMLAQILLGRIEQALNLLMDNNLELGGVHLLMLGDWLQQSLIK
jgi:hypothetical protein